MTTKQTWKLKRYGRFIPDSDMRGSTPWKVNIVDANLR